MVVPEPPPVAPPLGPESRGPDSGGGDELSPELPVHQPGAALVVAPIIEMRAALSPVIQSCFVSMFKLRCGGGDL